MINKISVPRGTHDILPDEIGRWQELENNSRIIFDRFAFREIRTPIYEQTALFKRSLGETSDIVHKQLLSLMTDKEDGLSLRPEGTAAVVRSYLENSLDGKESLSKLYYIGPMFRGERPQKGRLRQFHQMGAEAIGVQSDSPFLDAEMIVLAGALLKAAGVRDFKVNINSLGSLEDKAQIAQWLRDVLSSRRDKLCPDCQQRFEKNIFRILDCKNEGCKNQVNDLGNLPLSPASKEYFERVLASLETLGINYERNNRLVRGLDYYTHTVFEITASGLGSQDAVGAGGRYNSLLYQLGANSKLSYGAIGFALGMERMLLASTIESGKQGPLVDAYVVVIDPIDMPKAFELLQHLRQSGIRAEMSFQGGSVKSQMNKANKLSAVFALILGEQEIKNAQVMVKKMADATQELVSQQLIVNYIKQQLTT